MTRAEGTKQSADGSNGPSMMADVYVCTHRPHLTTARNSEAEGQGSRGGRGRERIDDGAAQHSTVQWCLSCRGLDWTLRTWPWPCSAAPAPPPTSTGSTPPLYVLPHNELLHCICICVPPEQYSAAAIIIIDAKTVTATRRKKPWRERRGFRSIHPSILLLQ